MKEINLRDFYPWYMEDAMVEVTEEVAEELLAGQRYIKASRRRVYRNKAHYSLDAEDGIEYSACFSNPSPQELIERMERFEYLCHALNSLPDAQGQRVFEHYLLGHSVKAIAAAEGVTEQAITAAIRRGLENMKKYLKLLDTLTGANATLLAYANKKIEDLDSRRKTLSKAIADLSVETLSSQQIELLSGYLDDWEHISFEDKRKAADGLISSISATSDYVKIEWKI